MDEPLLSEKSTQDNHRTIAGDERQHDDTRQPLHTRLPRRQLVLIALAMVICISPLALYGVLLAIGSRSGASAVTSSSVASTASQRSEQVTTNNYTGDAIVDGVLSRLDLGAYPLDTTSSVTNAGPAFLRNVFPLKCHSHNDEWRSAPLAEGLLAGCIAIEADVWYLGPSTPTSNAGADLYTGHDPGSLRANRTFDKLYVQPLLAMLNSKNTPTAQTRYIASLTSSNPAQALANSSEVFGLLGGKNGVFDTDPLQTLYLQADLKNRAVEGWLAVVAALQPLRDADYLTYVDSSGNVQYRAVTVTAGGVAPRDYFINTPNATYPRRDTFYDAPITALNSSGPVGGWTRKEALTASTAWSSVTTWRGFSSIPQAELDKIKGYVDAAHQRGILARYWDTPNRPRYARNTLWQTLQRDVGVDFVNTDEPSELAAQ